MQRIELSNETDETITVHTSEGDKEVNSGKSVSFKKESISPEELRRVVGISGKVKVTMSGSFAVKKKKRSEENEARYQDLRRRSDELDAREDSLAKREEDELKKRAKDLERREKAIDLSKREAKNKVDTKNQKNKGGSKDKNAPKDGNKDSQGGEGWE